MCGARFLEAEAVLAEISTARVRGGGIVRIGFTPDFSSYVLPAVMAGFRREYPAARFVARHDLPAVIEQWVASGEMDLGLFCSTADSSTVSTLYRAREPACVLWPADHPLARKVSLALDDVLAYPLVLPERGTTARQLFDLCCVANNRRVEPVLVTTFHPLHASSHG